MKETRNGEKSHDKVRKSQLSSTLIFCFSFPLLFCLGGSLNWIKQPRLIKLGWMTFQWHRIQLQPHPIPLYIFDMVIEELMLKWLRELFPLDSVQGCNVVPRRNVVSIVRFLESPVWFLLNPAFIRMPLRKKSTMNECEKIDNMLFQLEYELLSSCFSINLLPSFLSLVLLC